MAKKGIDHHLCRKHGAQGIVISEMPPNIRHRFQIECSLCKRWISWCSEKQAEEFAQRYGHGVRWSFRSQQPGPDKQVPSLPIMRDAQTWQERLDRLAQTLKESRAKSIGIAAKKPTSR